MTKKLTTLCLVFITSIAVAQTGTNSRYEVDECNKIIIDGGGNLQIYHSDNHTLEVKDNNDSDELVDFHVSSKTLI